MAATMRMVISLSAAGAWRGLEDESRNTRQNRGMAPGTAPGPAVQSRHLGRGAGLVDEHQALRVKVKLLLVSRPCAAGLRRADPAWPHARFSKSDRVAIQATPHRALGERRAMFQAQHLDNSASVVSLQASSVARITAVKLPYGVSECRRPAAWGGLAP